MNSFHEQTAKDKVVMFVHLPKTAGTTLRYIIQHQTSPNAIYEIYGLQQDEYTQGVEKLINLAENRKQQIKFVNSHIGFGLHKFLPLPYTYITVLRHPVDRFISLYYYHRMRNGSKIEPANDLDDLESFIKNHSGQRPNYMTRCISGMTLNSHLTALGFEQNYLDSTNILDTAKKNINEYFSVVGLTEKFDETLILLKQTLDWQLPLYFKSNVTKKRLSVKDMPQKIISLIEKENDLDIQLYEYVKIRFEQQINQKGYFFAKEVEEFKQTNQISQSNFYFKINTFYNRLMHRTYKELIRN